MSALIDVENLGRSFGEIVAVDGVSFRVGKGDVLGFLGPNGAGKSTTMKMITGFLTPSTGRVLVGGHDPVAQSREAKRIIGYLPENAPLYEDMTVRAFLNFIAEVREFPSELRRSAFDRVVGLSKIGTVLHQRIETLSKGYKRRVGLAQALIHDPQVLVLDEPTDGLDPNQKHEVRGVIRDMAREKCIILSTHILEEVDAVCNRTMIIARGRVVVDSTPDQLRRRSPHFGAVRIALAKPDPSARGALQRIPGVRAVDEETTPEGFRSYNVLPAGKEPIWDAVVRTAVEQRWDVENFAVDDGQLDDVFRALTQGDAR